MACKYCYTQNHRQLSTFIPIVDSKSTDLERFHRYAELVKNDVTYDGREERQNKSCRIYRLKGCKKRFYFNDDDQLVGTETNTYGHFLKDYR